MHTEWGGETRMKGKLPILLVWLIALYLVGFILAAVVMF